MNLKRIAYFDILAILAPKQPSTPPPHHWRHWRAAHLAHELNSTCPNCLDRARAWSGTKPSGSASASPEGSWPESFLFSTIIHRTATDAFGDQPGTPSSRNSFISNLPGDDASPKGSVPEPLFSHVGSVQNRNAFLATAPTSQKLPPGRPRSHDCQAELPSVAGGPVQNRWPICSHRTGPRTRPPLRNTHKRHNPLCAWFGFMLGIRLWVRSLHLSSPVEV